MRLRTTVGAAATLLLAAAALVTSSTAAAASDSNAKDASANGVTSVCIVYGAPAGPGLGYGGVELTTEATVCYDGVTAYVEAVTHGTATVPRTATFLEANKIVDAYRAVQARDTAVSGVPAPLASSKVGSGCNLENFLGTCWDFVVPSSTGCTGGSSWHWGTLSMNNQLRSWTASGSCSYGILYDLPNEPAGSIKITCYTCYSLGSMAGKASSLGVY